MLGHHVPAPSPVTRLDPGRAGYEFVGIGARLAQPEPVAARPDAALSTPTPERGTGRSCWSVRRSPRSRRLAHPRQTRPVRGRVARPSLTVTLSRLIPAKVSGTLLCLPQRAGTIFSRSTASTRGEPFTRPRWLPSMTFGDYAYLGNESETGIPQIHTC